MSVIIQYKRGTADQWSTLNPTLAAGEVGWESDTNKFKIGTGSTVWTSLPYATLTPSELTSGYARLAFPNTFSVGGHIINNNAVGTVPLTINGFAGQTADLLQLKSSAGTLLAKVDKNGAFSGNYFGPSGAGLLGYLDWTTNTPIFNTGGTGVIGLVVKGVASQSANLQEWQTNTGSIASRISASGQFVSDQQTYIGSGATSISNARFNVATGSASVVGAVIRGASGQTADLLQLQNATPSTLAVFDSSGRLNSTTAGNFGGLPAGLGFLGVQTSANTWGLVVRGGALQLNHLAVFQNSGGTTLGGVNANSQIFTGSAQPLTTATGGAINGVSGNGTTVTFSTTNAHNLANGDRVTIAGLTPAGYNGTYIISGVSAFSFDVANATTGAATGSGTVSVDAQISATARSAATTGILVRAAASQVSNPLEIQNSSGTVIANVSPSGGVRATGTLQGATLSAVSDGSTVATLSSSGNVQFRGTASYGGGVGVIGIANATTAPSTNPTGGGILFVNAGALQYRGTSGVSQNIVSADGTINFTGDISGTGGLYVSKTSYGFNTFSGAPASTTFWKIATLPTSSAGTYDHVLIQAVLDDDWGSTNKSIVTLLLANRNSYTYRYYLQGTVRSNARIVTYTEADGSISVYLRASASTYTSFSYNITHGIHANTIIYKNPSSTTTAPTGTLSFDSGVIATYVPEMYIPHTGQPIIRGLVNSSGVVSGTQFVRSGGTSSQFLKADGSIDSNIYLATNTSSNNYGSSYFAGHNTEGRIMYNAYLTNDMANARLRGSAVSATQNGSPYSISDANWDAMFDGTASFFNISPTSGFTFPLVITVPLPRTLTYGASVGLSFGSTTFRANSVQIEVFSLDSNSWVSVFNTTTNTSEDIFTAVSGLTNGNATGINQVRYTISSPNSTQLRIAHLWAYNFNSDMWSQTMMPRAGGAFYGAIRNNNTLNGFGVSSTPASWGGFTPTVEIRGSSSSISGINFFMNGGPFIRAHDGSGNAKGAWANDGSIVVGPSNTKLGTLSVYSDASGTVGQVIRGATSQSSDLLQIQNSTPQTMSKIDSLGRHFIPGGTTIYDYAVESAGGTDTAWKKLIEVNCASGLYTGASYQVDVVDNFDNYGIAGNANVPQTFKFYVKITRSMGTQDDVLAAVVLGPSVNYVRVVKTSSALYEIQVRQPDIYRVVSYKVRRITQNNTTESYNPSGKSYGSLDAGSTTGTIYVPLNSSATLSNFVVENFSHLDSNKLTVEPLSDGIGVVPVTIRGVSGQTADLLQIQNSSSTNLINVTSAGNLNATGQIRVGTTSGLGQLAVVSTGSATIAAVIRGEASQSANLTEWQLGDASVRSSVSANGRFAIRSVTLGDAAASLYVGAINTTDKPVVVRGAVSQSANLTEWQISDGTVKSYITADGSFLTASTLTTTQNLRVAGLAGTGGGSGVIGIANAGTVPSTNPANGGVLYVNTGALQYRGTSGSAATIVNADGTSPYPTLSGNNTFTGNQIWNNSVSLGPGLNASVGFEIGYTGGTATTPYIDFHSGATAIDYDSRIIASGGNGTNGQGTLTYTAAQNTFTGAITTNGAVNLNYASPSITSNNASAASIFTSTVTGITIGSSTIRTTEFPADGTTSTATAGAGYMGLPQNATTTGSYTIVAADAGKHIYASATRTVTINSNANLALPIGTTLTFIAGPGATMTIAITSDTMYLAGPGTTGSRTLAPYGMATAVKITSTSWMISGNGLT